MRLTAILGVGYVAVMVRVAMTTGYTENFVYPATMTLDHHRIRRDAVVPGVAERFVVLGNSVVSGVSVPVGTSVTSYLNLLLAPGRQQAYNLAVWGGNVMSSVAYYAIARPYAPQTVILGLSPEDLAHRDHLPTVAVVNREAVREFLGADLGQVMRLDRGAASELQYLFSRMMAGTILSSHDLIVKQTRLLVEAQRWVYGQYLRAPLDADDAALGPVELDPDMLRLLEQFGERLTADHVRVIVYLNPMRPNLRRNQPPELEAYAANVTRAMAKSRIRVLDLSAALPATDEYFADSVHLTKAGSQRVAQRLHEVIGQ